MYASSHSRAAVANNRQGGLGLLGLMAITVLLLAGLPSGEDQGTLPSVGQEATTVPAGAEPIRGRALP